jgi:hypothetical protein
VGTIWTAATGTVKFTNCVFFSAPTGVHCNYTLTAVSQLALPVTNANVDITCRMYQGATNFCHIHGSTPAHYINPPDARLILTHSNTLRTTNTAAGSCPLGNGGPTTLTQQTWTLTSANPPSITRRP